MIVQKLGDIGTSYILSLALLGLSACIGYSIYRYNKQKKSQKEKPVRYAKDENVEHELEAELARIRDQYKD